jgi:hypothetical protein
VLIVGLLAVGLPRLAWRRRGTELAIIVGIVIGLEMIYLVAGKSIYLDSATQSVYLDSARYAVFLCVPSCIAFASLLDASLDGGGSPDTWESTTWAGARPALWVALAIGTAMAASFSSSYLYEVAHTGGRAHSTFRTGAVEPKQATLAAIVARTSGPVVVLAEDWWCYQPIAYLARRTPRVTVELSDDPVGRSLAIRRQNPKADVFAVGFDGAAYESKLSKLPVFQATGAAVDPTGRPILKTWQSTR